MFENYKYLGSEKWEIYMNVVRKIYSELGNLEECEMGFRDLKRYIKAMRTGFYDPYENINFDERIKNKEINMSNCEILEISTKKFEEKCDN